MLTKCGEQMNMQYHFNVDNAIFKIGIIILASQSVLAVFFLQNTLCKPEEHDINIDVKDMEVSIRVTVDKYRSQIGIIDMQHYL